MKISKPATFLAELDKFPPYVCWLIARHKDRHTPVSQEEIVQKTGWSFRKVQRFCGLKSWATVSVADADTFRQACGITRANERRQREYIKRTLDFAKVVTGLSPARRRPTPAQARLVRLLKSQEQPSLGAAPPSSPG